MLDFEELDAKTQARAASAVKNFLRDGGYKNFLAAIYDLAMEPHDLWSMVMRDAGLPECRPPMIIRTAYQQDRRPPGV